MRDAFFKQLGFDCFIDETEFSGALREGPYIADSAVTEKILDVLERVEKPCFVFAITMENHGPLHLETVGLEEWTEYYHNKPDTGLDDLTAYLRHLKNANTMVETLSSDLKARKRHALLGFYGDHVPAISGVFEALNYNDPRSNYFIWSSRSDELISKQVDEREMTAEALAPYLLSVLSNPTHHD